MSAFTPRRGALTLGALALLYALGALATGHTVHSRPPADLQATPEAPLDAWKAAARLLQAPDTRVVDLRTPEAFRRYHLPGALNLGSGEAARLPGPLLLVADGDEAAAEAARELRARTPGREVFWLAGGVRAWYLAFELPVPLFSDGPVPPGYDGDLARVKAALAAPALAAPAGDPEARQALDRLARANLQPTLLQPKGRPRPAAGGSARKISGGCG